MEQHTAPDTERAIVTEHLRGVYRIGGRFSRSRKEVVEIVSTSPSAASSRVERSGNGGEETRLAARYPG